MPDDIAGKFIKIIFQYQTTGILPEMDFALEMAVTPFINQFSRDNEKYETFVISQSENGKKGGRPKKPSVKEETQKTQPFFEKPNESQKSLSVSVNDSVSKSDNDIECPPPPEMILDLYIEQDLLSCAKGYFLHSNFQHAIELLLMNHNVKEKTVNELKHTALEFNKHCALEGKVKRSLTEWGKHFKNWLIDPKRVYATSNVIKSSKEIEKYNEIVFGNDK